MLVVRFAELACKTSHMSSASGRSDQNRYRRKCFTGTLPKFNALFTCGSDHSRSNASMHVRLTGNEHSLPNALLPDFVPLDCDMISRFQLKGYTFKTMTTRLHGCIALFLR